MSEHKQQSPRNSGDLCDEIVARHRSVQELKKKKIKEKEFLSFQYSQKLSGLNKGEVEETWN